jgi:sugar O-acyltransferase (sialic acid O-acetyltransferase NeuD family)
LQWAKDVNRRNRRWNIEGFLSDDKSKLDDIKCDYTIVGDVENWLPEADDEYLIAIGGPNQKTKVVNHLRRKGAKFVTLIHPTAQVSEFTSIGEGSIICPNAEISPNVNVGNFCTILNAGIGHDVLIGDFTTISGGCFLNGGVKVGVGVFVGCGALIVPNRCIGDGAKIGIGSVVINNVAKETSVFGNPAKKIN